MLQIAVQGTTVIKLALVLGPESYGLFCFAAIIGTFGILLGGFGGDQVLIMFGSRDQELLSALLGNALLLRGLFSAVACLVCFSVGLAYGLTTTPLLSFMLIVLAHLFLGFVQPLLASYYRVIGRVRIPWLGMLFTNSMFLVYIFISQPNLTSLLAVSLFYLGLNIALFFVLVINSANKIRPKISLALLKKNCNLSIMFWLTKIVDLLFARIDVFLIQAFLGVTAVGIYSLGYRFVAVLIAIPSAVHIVMQPELHRCAKDRERRMALFYRIRRLMLEIGCLVTGLTCICGGKLLELLSSNEYKGSLPIVIIISMHTAVNYVAYPYSMLVEAEGLITQRFWVRVWSLCITLILCVALIHWFGIIGAAIGVLCGMITFLVLLHILFIRQYERWNHLASEMKPLVAAAIGVAGCTLLSFYLPYSNFGFSSEMFAKVLGGNIAMNIIWIGLQAIIFMFLFFLSGHYMSLLKHIDCYCCFKFAYNSLFQDNTNINSTISSSVRD